MRQKPAGRPSSSERTINEIRRKTRKQYSAEEKIRIVLDGLRGEDSIAELCRLCWYNMLAQSAARGENTMKSREIHSRLRNQRRQAPYKLHWAQDNVGSAVVVGSF